MAEVRLAPQTIRDFKRAARRLELYGEQMFRPIGSGLRQIGEEIMTDVKASSPGRGVPVDTGTLRGSGKVEGPLSGTGDVLLSFGGAAAPYALIQHEVQYHHKIGEVRYLTRGVNRWRPHGSAAMEALKIQAEYAAKVVKAKAP